MTIISVVASCCSLIVAIYGLVYRHVSKMHEKIDTLLRHVHAHDISDAKVQTELRKDVDDLGRRVKQLEESAA